MEKCLNFSLKFQDLRPTGLTGSFTKPASLNQHIDGTGIPPLLVSIDTGTEPLTATQQKTLDDNKAEISRWQSEEAIIRQTIASTISDSLFLEVRKKVTAVGMWEAVKDQREKKS